MPDLDHRAIVAEIATLTERMNQSHRDAEEAKRQRERFDAKMDHVAETLAKISSTQDRIGEKMEDGAKKLNDYGSRIATLETAKTKAETALTIAHGVGGLGLASGLTAVWHMLTKSH